MDYHTRLFEAALKDVDFQLSLKMSSQTPPIPAASIDRAIWAAGYAGWVLGNRGAVAFHKLKDI